MYILGISAFFHDSAACLISDGKIVAAAQEERFSRVKHDESFPEQAVRFCLKSARIELKDISTVVFYDKPFLKFERLIESSLAFVPRGLPLFLKSMPIWIKEKLFLKTLLIRELRKIGEMPPIYFTSHHQSHAASAFYPSPFESAAVLCLDGVGEWATTSAWKGEGGKLTPIWQIDFPHSLGLLYSAFTYFLGFKVNSGEYKVMGLAPYGEPKYKNLILENLIDLKEDGTFRLDMSYFNYTVGLTMTNKKFSKLFGISVRKSDQELTQKHMDIARSIQDVTEEAVLRLAREVHKNTDQENLCLAGGVALNCVANGRILREGPFKKIWIQPAAGDAGGAIGAALAYWCQENERIIDPQDSMKASLLGPSYDPSQIKETLDKLGANYEILSSEETATRVAELIKKEKVVGHFHGKMEFGPRALGNRSILGDPRSEKMQKVLNLKIKKRESFRPFAPAILEEKISEFFDIEQPSPYMLLVAPLKDKIEMDPNLSGLEKLPAKRSSVPAITHVDYSARIQSVSNSHNPRFHAIIESFYKMTGCPIVINTSFNVRGEPIVCTPEDAFRCFMNTDMDFLVLENIVLDKKKQPTNKNWSQEFAPD